MTNIIGVQRMKALLMFSFWTHHEGLIQESMHGDKVNDFKIKWLKLGVWIILSKQVKIYGEKLIFHHPIFNFWGLLVLFF